MLTESSLKELNKWVEFPHLFKYQISKAVKSGYLLRVIGTEALDSELLLGLRGLLCENLKTLDSKSLIKLYKTLNKQSTTITQSRLTRFEKDFVRVNPMKRECAHLT